MSAAAPSSLGAHQSAFGFLRLLFASLVIVAHTPALADGDAHREIVTRLFGSTTFGEIAVGGFFIISGFLITGSYLRSRSIGDYLLRRSARIYPGYIVAFIISVFVFAPIGGAVFSRSQMVLYTFKSLPILGGPYIHGAFAGQPYADTMNGSMWTLAYEFRCYILVILLGRCGLLKQGWPLAVAAVLCAFASALLPNTANDLIGHNPKLSLLLGRPTDGLRMTAEFLAGSAFYLLRHSVPMRSTTAIGAATGLLLALFSPVTATAGVVIFGSYLTLWAAAAASTTWLARVNDKTDISYGVYLYAWPVELCLIRFTPPTTMLWQIAVATWVVAAVFGWLSWTFVEHPAQAWVRDWRRGGAPLRGATAI